MSGTDFGVNDPNLLQLLSGINDPQGIAALVNAGPSGRIRIPAMQARNDEAVRNFLEVLAKNNATRAGLSGRKIDNEADKIEMDYLQNMTGHLKDFKSGNPEDVTPFAPLIRRGSKSFGIQHLINQNATKAYTAAEEAKARHQDVDVGFEPPAGGGPNAPRTFQGNPKIRAADVTANTATRETVRSPSGKVLNIIDREKMPSSRLDRSSAPLDPNPNDIGMIQNYTETGPNGNTYKPFKGAAVEVLPNKAGVRIIRKNKNGAVEKIIIPYKNGELDMTAGQPEK